MQNIFAVYTVLVTYARHDRAVGDGALHDATLGRWREAATDTDTSGLVYLNFRHSLWFCVFVGARKKVVEKLCFCAVNSLADLLCMWPY